MTPDEIYDALKQIPQKQLLEMKNLLDDTKIQSKIDYVYKFNAHTATAIDYLIQAVLRDDAYGRTNRATLSWGELSRLTLPVPGSFLNNLPSEILPYIPKNIVSRIKTKANKQLLLDKAKNLQLNEFSFIAYEASIKARKVLSGTEAIAQIKKLPNPKSPEEELIYDKFLTLFWDNIPKKSLELCDTIISRAKRTIYAPLETLTMSYNQPEGHYISKYFNLDSYKPSVHMTLFYYQKVAEDFNIPILKEGYSDTYSTHHDWITGVEKPTPLKPYQLRMTISQILILDYIIKYIQKDNVCPYFTQMKEHLIKEISKPIYKEEIEKLQLQNSYTSTQETVNGLIQIHS